MSTLDDESQEPPEPVWSAANVVIFRRTVVRPPGRQPFNAFQLVWICPLGCKRLHRTIWPVGLGVESPRRVKCVANPGTTYLIELPQ